MGSPLFPVLLSPAPLAPAQRFIYFYYICDDTALRSSLTQILLSALAIFHIFGKHFPREKSTCHTCMKIHLPTN